MYVDQGEIYSCVFYWEIAKLKNIKIKWRRYESKPERRAFCCRIDKIVLDNGRIIALTADYKAVGRSRVVQSVAGSVLISSLFVHTKGKNVIYKEGDEFVAYVLENYQF